MQFTKLFLFAPLFFAPDDGIVFPPPVSETSGSFIFRFELKEDDAFRIPPDAASYLGSPAECGREAAAGPCEIRPGEYFFTQARRETPPDAELCTEVAIELQMQGHWERRKMGGSLWLRFLCEDGAIAVQAFRPLVS
jgi:hypothetical protein